ncbi:hypothetical protein [Chitinophaga sancti]|uniref:Uncharacterized protein n=1 Tax=Chitinophaga sancti TaxID=1004 RepID=A0A1K1SZ94_9BACT|nr:hypothetical protein [Chitinophaga sancti]WQD63647.1 hypothetical protein U0033_04510 [Chitinophaga sancti]WQG90728.1 hypothetical protein SR876_04410 [Chitinophaga sancti]SFW89619.1 hypothetical protein SAMN05661012_06459 [Chitinophaga sancti]
MIKSKNAASGKLKMTKESPKILKVNYSQTKGADLPKYIPVLMDSTANQSFPGEVLLIFSLSSFAFNSASKSLKDD